MNEKIRGKKLKYILALLQLSHGGFNGISPPTHSQVHITSVLKPGGFQVCMALLQPGGLWDVLPLGMLMT